jgi:hypothetical protein
MKGNLRVIVCSRMYSNICQAQRTCRKWRRKGRGEERYRVREEEEGEREERGGERGRTRGRERRRRERERREEEREGEREGERGGGGREEDEREGERMRRKGEEGEWVLIEGEVCVIREVQVSCYYTRSCDKLKIKLCSLAITTARTAVLCPNSTAIGLDGTYGFQRYTMWSKEPPTSRSRGRL